MKKILFVCSHPYSGSSALWSALNQHPRIQGFSLAARTPYVSPLNLLALADQSHKMHNRSAIYMDELLYNHHLCTKAAYKECKFVYVVREPEPVLNYLVGNDKAKPSFAARRYAYRLRRLCEMAKRTPGAVLLTWDDLVVGRGLNLIEEYLGLRQPILYDPALLAPYQRSFPTALVAPALLAATEEAYQRYLYFLKSQNLRYWT